MFGKPLKEPRACGMMSTSPPPPALLYQYTDTFNVSFLFLYFSGVFFTWHTHWQQHTHVACDSVGTSAHMLQLLGKHECHLLKMDGHNRPPSPHTHTHSIPPPPPPPPSPGMVEKTSGESCRYSVNPAEKDGFNPLALRLAKRGLTILERFY